MVFFRLKVRSKDVCQTILAGPASPNRSFSVYEDDLAGGQGAEM
jgi:hypothetical protein